jgi:ligand-binding sensor protein
MKLIDFMDMSQLQKIQDDFSEATGLAAIAVDADGNYITKGSNFTDFCMKYTRGCPEGARRCQKCDATGKGVYECHAGLMDFSIDIMLNGEKLGSMIGGQVLPEAPDEEKFAAIAEEFHIDSRTYVNAAKKVPVRPEKSIRAAAALLEQIVNSSVRQEYMNATEYKKIHVWEEEIANATETVAEIKKYKGAGGDCFQADDHGSERFHRDRQSRCRRCRLRHHRKTDGRFLQEIC